MVKIRKSQQPGQHNVEFDIWLQQLGLDKNKIDALVGARSQLPELDTELDAYGREMVEILAGLNMDAESLIAGYLFPYVDLASPDAEWLEETYGKQVCGLLNGVSQMDAIRSLQLGAKRPSAAQVDNLRRMLLSMVEDVRAVVVKLAERVCYLHRIKNADDQTRVMAAKETSSIYAPLANRLGIGQLKWELEDFAFRFLQPDAYKDIAKLLDEKRAARQQYVEDFVSDLERKLAAANVKAEVYGRPKHIYSIWKKMEKKGTRFEDLFDIRAMRILVDELEECYTALGVVHTNWSHLASEFVDYVANPKPNGYQSIHTIVNGPEGKNIEIQIRTHQMHNDAELGVAAHWKYKEGPQSSKSSGFDEKINWLRKILSWQEEASDSGELVEELRSQVFEDRVYVFTPQGDVVDLPTGATPLDFAYYIHSNVGHRCIGAKIAGRIVPFNHQLQTGDQVEILTSKEPNPSRDWLNPNSGYVRSSRARAKIQHWFKQLDRDKNLAQGKEVLDKELSRLGMKMADLEPAVERFNLSNMEDLITAVGAGDVKLNQVLNFLQNQQSAQEEEPEVDPRLVIRQAKGGRGGLMVQGVGNLLTNLANCCSPVPGDNVTGFITQGRGVSIHRSDCEQFKHLQATQGHRVLPVKWGEKYSGGYAASIRIFANDRSGLIRDVTTILANEKINVLDMSSRSDSKNHSVILQMKLEILDNDALVRVLNRIGQVEDVREVKRIGE